MSTAATSTTIAALRWVLLGAALAISALAFSAVKVPAEPAPSQAEAER